MATLQNEVLIVQELVQNQDELKTTDIHRVMIWEEDEVESKQVQQIGQSACGATAVINVLKVLNENIETEAVENAVKTRLRDYNAPLPTYLLSRSVAGAAHEDLINATQEVTDSRIIGKFFHFYPKRDVDLVSWLGEWITTGAVPVVTLNLQCGQEDGSVPDAWHHQMICGVSEKGIHLCNPNQILPLHIFKQQICSMSILLVMRKDVLSRWKLQMDFSLFDEDVRWKEMKVVEQINNMVKEETFFIMYGIEPDESDENHVSKLTSHISIPACYKSGISLFVLKESPAYEKLMSSADLPLKDS